MSNVIVTIKVMPNSPEADLNKLYSDVEKEIRAFTGEKFKNTQLQKEIEPIGFGLKALKITFLMNEEQGSPEPLEEKIQKLENVESVQTIGVSRALG